MIHRNSAYDYNKRNTLLFYKSEKSRSKDLTKFEDFPF